MFCHCMIGLPSFALQLHIIQVNELDDKSGKLASDGMKITCTQTPIHFVGDKVLTQAELSFK